MIRKQTEILWREEKYNVMFHSQFHYNKIRAAMKAENYIEVPALLADALNTPATPGSKRNAIMHMWGYFKKFATAEEKDRYQGLLQHEDFNGLLQFLKELAVKYDVKYLLESRVLRD